MVPGVGKPTFSKHSPVNRVSVKRLSKVFDLSSTTEEVARPHFDGKNFTSSPGIEVEPLAAHSLTSVVCVPGGPAVPEPQGGAQEQPAVHPGPAAGHVPASAHHPVPLRGQDGDPG